MLSMEAVVRRFGSLTALDEINLDIPSGSIFALAGPNGAGKSTALKLCVNLLRPTSGRVEVFGVESRRLGPSQLTKIGYVSEHRQLPDWMTATAWFAYLKPFYPDWHDEDLAELLGVYQLPASRPLRSLSRGMRMQAALCAALAYRPSLLLLDEPFSGLDVLVREQLIETLAARSGETTVVLASHDLAEIESFATHVAYVSEGKLRFVEEMGALSSRFREIEVMLDSPSVVLPPELPRGWLNLEQSTRTVRFVHSRYEAAHADSEIRAYFSDVCDVAVRALPLRSIFVALAKAAATSRQG